MLQSVISLAQFSKMVINTTYGTSVADAYANFLKGASAFPAFGSGPSGALEVAAFIGNTVQETGAPVAPGKGTCVPTGQACSSDADCGSGGACHLSAFAYQSELACVNDPARCAPLYCDPTKQPTCSTTATVGNDVYYGRGALQLSWNYNYGAYGASVGKNFAGSADAIVTDPSNLFGSAIWFWMTSRGADGGKTCHEAVTQSPPDFGRTVFVINGGIECAAPGNPAATQRGEYFKIAASILGVTIPAGTNFDCSSSGKPAFADQAWCGTTWADAMCRQKPCFGGTDSECGAGQKCFLSPVNFCGTDFANAAANAAAGANACPSGTDAECSSAAPHCYRVKSPYGCGTSYADACSKRENAAYACDGTNSACAKLGANYSCYVLPDQGCPSYATCQPQSVSVVHHHYYYH